MRTALLFWMLSMLVGCASAPVYAPLPRAVRASVRRDLPGCDDPRGFVLDPEHLLPPGAEGLRYEVRSCGRDAIYFCPNGTGRRETCVLERSVVTSGGDAPSGAFVPSAPAADAASIERERGRAEEIERLVLVREQLSLEGPIALTVTSPLLVAGGLVLATYEGLRGACAAAWGGCGMRTVYPDDGIVAAGLLMAGVGAVLTIAGGAWWGTTRHARSEATDRITEACTGISFGLSPSFAGVALRQCFP